MIILQCSVKTKAMRIYSRGMGLGSRLEGRIHFAWKSCRGSQRKGQLSWSWRYIKSAGQTWGYKDEGIRAEGTIQTKAWRNENAGHHWKMATLWHLKARRGILAREGRRQKKILGQTVPLCWGFGLYQLRDGETLRVFQWGCDKIRSVLGDADKRSMTYWIEVERRARNNEETSAVGGYSESCWRFELGNL